MFKRLVAAILFALLIVSCGKSNTTGSNATKAASALSSAFNSGSRTAMLARAEQELRTQAWAAQFKAARLRDDMPTMTMTCDMFTGATFCARNQGLKDENGTETVSCSQTSSGDSCDTTCDGTGKKVALDCGKDKVTMSDLIMTAGMTKPTCTDDNTNLTMTFCMAFKSMTANVDYNGTKGALKCGKSDGTEKMCMTMKFPKNLSSAGAGADQSAPSQESNLTCTLDGTAVTMDFAGGGCSK